MDLKNIFDILAEQDIVPVGEFESLPVTHRHSGLALDYPDVVALKDVPNYDELLAEARHHIEHVGPRYLKDRIPYLDKRIPIDQLLNFISDVGFKKGLYQSYSLRRLGSSELDEFIKNKTRNFFSALPLRTFRQHYAVAEAGWKTKLHLDHKDFKVHGFRAMVPLSDPVYMGYVDLKGDSKIYCLPPGRMYFVNTAKMHRGFSFAGPRINLIFQMNNDEMILAPGATPLPPLSDLSDIPEEMKVFETLAVAQA